MTSTDDTGGRYESIVETIADGVLAFDTDGQITFVNAAVAEFVGMSREALVGSSLGTLHAAGVFETSEYERLADTIETVCTGDEREQTLLIETADGDSVLHIRLAATAQDGIVEEVVGTIRDVTDRERTRSALEANRAALQRLYEINTDPDRTDSERLEAVLGLGCEYLGLPYGFLTTVSGQTQRLEYVVGDSDILTPGGTVQLSDSYCRETVKSDGLVAHRNVPDENGPDDPAYSKFGLSCYIGTKILVGGVLYGTFCFAADDAREVSFSPTEQQFVKLLGQWAGYTIERQQFEDRLRGLNAIAENLVTAESAAAVAEHGVETSATLFDLPVTACWEATADGSLHPLAATERYRSVVGEPTPIEPGERAHRCFADGELRVYQDLTDEPTSHTATLGSEIHVPLGDHGVLISGATEPQGFTETDIESLELLGQLIEAALIAVKRRDALAQRGESIQRQNERLEEFARVVAHDLRNPLTGAVGFLEIARETNNPGHFDRVGESLERMRALIDELLDIARGTRQDVETRTLSLEPIVREAWSYLDEPAATLSVVDDLGQLDADETRLLQLFGNLFRNSAEHGVGADGSVTVEVGRLSDAEGFYVANDGPAFPEQKRLDVLAAGQTSSETGTGIGLLSVTDVADAHGWTFDITETDTGGPRFEFETDP